MRKFLRFFSSTIVFAIFLFTLALVHAATFTVNTTTDTVDASVGDGVCADDTGSCSLRAAIQEANGLLGTDVIDLPTGTYALTLPSALPNISGDLTINGAGLDSTLIDGSGLYRVFAIGSHDPLYQVAISGVTITGGSVGNFDLGGGIANSGNLTITDSLIRDNMTGYAGVGGGIANNGGILTITNSMVSHNSIGTFWSQSQGGGGGIYNAGTLSVINSTISGNYGLFGGGVYHQNGTMSIISSTISGNIAHYISQTATGNGGGILASNGTVDINGATINDNSAYYGGGDVPASGIYNDNATMSITNSTISGNGVYSNSSGCGVANGSGMLTISNSTIINNDDSNSYGGSTGGVKNYGGTVSLFNTIVANQGAGPDCSGTITSNGYNLDSDGTCNLTEETDLPSTDPLLGLLVDNGGPSLTHEPSPGSPVIDTGAAANCPPMDQRGVTRPQDGNADSIAICDMGSVEFVVIPGDVDRNFVIEMKDAILALQLMSDIATPVPVFKIADINGDGMIGLVEAIYALQSSSELRIGFTYTELFGNTFQITDVEYPTCGVFDITFISNNQFEIFGETINYTIDNGCIIWSDESLMIRELCAQSRDGEQITASVIGTGAIYVDHTDQWGTDFSILNNDATALKDWFIVNGWWPGRAILADGRVTNQDAPIDGKWWIDNNILFIDHPEADGCVDHKAYKLENDRLMFATDAAFTSIITMIKK